MKIWRLQAESRDDVLPLLRQKIKEAALLVYIYTTLSYYNSYSLVTIAELFALDLPTTTRIVAQVLFVRDYAQEMSAAPIKAGIKPDSKTLVVLDKGPNQVQNLAESLAGKVNCPT